MADTFERHNNGLESPPPNVAAITPNDSADMAYASRGLFLNVAGDVTYHPVGDQGDASVTMTYVAGVWHPFRAVRILATGTTATGIHTGW